MNYEVRLEYDSDAESPCKYGDWEIVSFCDRHVNFQDPFKYLGPRDEFGDPTPATIGMRRKLDVGSAFILSCYQHSGTVWSLRGEGMQCRWDTADVGGLIISKNAKFLPKDYEKRKEYARNFLGSYNTWVNGEYYQFSIYDEDGLYVEGCCGYDDPDYMMACVWDYMPVDYEEVEFTGEAAWAADRFEQKRKSA
jgi:hypothetical protein